MGETLWFGLPIYEILIPGICWLVIIIHHAMLVKGHVFSLKQQIGNAPSVYSFFAQVRIGWVKQNHLTGQASANSTRDYLRVLLFYAGNAVLLSTLSAGYCATSLVPNGTAYENLLTAKLGLISVLFLAIFLVMVYALRYGTHFHMMMNVKEIQGMPVKNHLRIIEIVYHKSHFFFSTGQRMFFLLVPAFGWVINAWVLLAAAALYLVLIHQYDDVGWMQDDIAQLQHKGKPQPADGDAMEKGELELPLLGQVGAPLAVAQKQV